MVTEFCTVAFNSCKVHSTEPALCHPSVAWNFLRIFAPLNIVFVLIFKHLMHIYLAVQQHLFLIAIDIKVHENKFCLH
jgi:hypothetical protein